MRVSHSHKVRGETSTNRRWRVRACASTHLRRLLGLFEDMLSSSQIRHVQQLLAVQNVDPVNPMLDHAFPFALLAMSNAAQLEYAHH